MEEKKIVLRTDDIASALTRKIEFLPCSELAEFINEIPDPIKEPLKYFFHCRISTKESRVLRKNELKIVMRFLTGKDEITDEEFWNFPMHEITYNHAILYYEYLKRTCKLNTANQRFGLLKTVLKYFKIAGLMSEYEFQKIRLIKIDKYQPEKVGRFVERREIEIILRMLKTKMEEERGREYSYYKILVRNAALLAVAYSTGARTRELSNLDVKNLDPSDCSVRIVCGKGGKSRTVYLSDAAEIYVNEWISIKGRSAPLFTAFNSNKNGLKPSDRRIRRDKIIEAVRWMCDASGVERFTIHDLRRTYISNLLLAGADPFTVAALAGHSSIKTTMIYDRRPERVKMDTRNIQNFEVMI